MHELGLCGGIVDAVARRAGGRPVARVRVQAAELVLLPVAVRCRGCGAVTESAEPVVTCPRCGEFELDHRGGRELLLESLEYRG